MTPVVNGTRGDSQSTSITTPGEEDQGGDNGDDDGNDDNNGNDEENDGSNEG